MFVSDIVVYPLTNIPMTIQMSFDWIGLDWHCQRGKGFIINNLLTEYCSTVHYTGAFWVVKMIIFEQKIIFFQKLKLFENWCPLILVPKHFWEPTVLYFSWGPTGNYGPFCHFKVGAKFAPRYYQGSGVRMASPLTVRYF